MVPPVAPEAVPPPDHKPTPTVGTPHAENTFSGASSEFKYSLASTGLDINRLLRSGDAPAEGGPYIALNDPRAAALHHQRLDDLKRLAKNLPLAAPLNAQYSIGSEFGARSIRSITARLSIRGSDFDAPYESTVYSTGAGTVIFTGAMDSYGRVVEIDHGHGIVTLDAHLHRILVAKGQQRICIRRSPARQHRAQHGSAPSLRSPCRRHGS